MKRKNYFNDQIEISCNYCKNGSEFDGAVICKLGHHLTPEGTCKHFSYDPLKRQPTTPPVLKSFDPDDFKL